MAHKLMKTYKAKLTETRFPNSRWGGGGTHVLRERPYDRERYIIHESQPVFGGGERGVVRFTPGGGGKGGRSC